MMKSLMPILVWLLLCLNLPAQQSRTETVNAERIEKLYGDFEWGNAVFSSWNRNEIEIKATYSINDGENDDAFQLKVKENNNQLSVYVDVKDFESLPRKIMVWKDGVKYIFPEGKDKEENQRMIREKLGEEARDMYSHGVDIDIQVEIKVPERLFVNVESTYGNLVFDSFQNKVKAKNTYGGIEAVYSSGESPKEADLSSTYSYVDVSLPDSEGRNIEMTTEYGSLYTDMNIELDADRSEERSFYQRVAGTINRGGVSIKMESTYSSVYLRKL
ncbi:MAG: hypothetical protein AAGC85_25700 [Bacteroidota bacterium]